MIRGAIFDADGTLFDSMHIWSGVGSGYLKTMGIEAKEDLDERFKEISLYQSAVLLKEEYSLPLTIEEISDGINKMVDDAYANDVQLKVGVAELLEGLHRRGVKMCVASATESYQIRMALERCGVAKYFVEVYSCGDVGHGKDEPVIFRTAMDRMGTTRENTYVFEDALYSVKTAKADGFGAIGIYDKWMEYQDELIALVDYYIKDYRALDAFWKFIDSLV